MKRKEKQIRLTVLGAGLAVAALAVFTMKPEPTGDKIYGIGPEVIVTDASGFPAKFKNSDGTLNQAGHSWVSNFFPLNEGVSTSGK